MSMFSLSELGGPLKGGQALNGGWEKWKGDWNERQTPESVPWAADICRDEVFLFLY